MEKRLIAVVGSTGSQGGGLARAILDDAGGTFDLRAITRNPDSDRARQLAARGAEVVRADLDDVDSLTAAFEGCHGAFCVTNFWEHLSPEKETRQAQNLAIAARRAGIRHAIWSTLEDTRAWVPLEDDRMPTLQGQYKVPHFDAKGQSDRFFAEEGVPTTYFAAAFYWDNLIHFGMGPQRGEDGRLVFALPMGDARLPGIAAEDIGKCALGVFKAGDTMIGRRVGVAGDQLTGAQMAEVLATALGEPVGYYAVPFDTYRSFGFPGAEDLGNMFQHHHDFNEDFLTLRDVDLSRTLNPELQSFTDWVNRNAAALLPK